MAIYSVGGQIGQLLCRLVEEEGIRSVTIPILQDKCENFTVLDAEKQEQYRFVLPGPTLSEKEWRACLDAFTSIERPPHFIVASGSLPPGVAADFYRRLVQLAQGRGGKVVVDTSGPPLKYALDIGVYLVKPSLRELRELLGESLERESDFIAACRRLVETGRTEVVALTLGPYGALLVMRNLICAPMRCRSSP